MVSYFMVPIVHKNSQDFGSLIILKGKIAKPLL
jgi:hypothetical protein